MQFAQEIGPQLTPGFLQNVLDHYGQGQIVSWNPFTGGWTNINIYLLTSQGEFILRIYKYGVRTHLAIGLETQVINHLYKKGLPVARAYTNQSGSYITPVNLGGKKLDLALFSFLPGEERPHPTREDLLVIGRTLARTHLGLADFRAAHTKKYFRLKFETLRLASKISSRLKPAWVYPKVISPSELKSLWRVDREYLLSLDRRQGSKLRAVSVIHGDFHPGNIKFEGDE
ncbi:MAG TPA: phosphotransferase, partial [Patescibacteria group bacterium]|nr:phosphotransferase [Patescibacteria group bacterium]